MPVVSRKEWKKMAEKGRGETPSSVSGRCVGWCHGARQSPRQDARCWEATACRLGDHGVPATYPAASGPSPPALAVRTQPLGGHAKLPAVRRGCTEPAALRAFPSTDPGGHTHALAFTLLPLTRQPPGSAGDAVLVHSSHVAEPRADGGPPRPCCARPRGTAASLATACFFTWMH